LSKAINDVIFGVGQVSAVYNTWDDLLNTLAKQAQSERLVVVIDINWHPLAIQTDDWMRSWAEANSELRGFMAAGAAALQGRDAFLRLHDALELAVHEQLLELGDEMTLLGAAQLAGLDADRFQKDWRDPLLIRAVQQSHRLAVEKWNVSGTPTIVFNDKHSIHLEFSRTPPQAAALETFRAIETLTVSHPYIAQLRNVFSIA
jgi:hypothetical protein